MYEVFVWLFFVIFLTCQTEKVIFYSISWFLEFPAFLLCYLSVPTGNESVRGCKKLDF